MKLSKVEESEVKATEKNNNELNWFYKNIFSKNINIRITFVN